MPQGRPKNKKQIIILRGEFIGKEDAVTTSQKFYFRGALIVTYVAKLVPSL